ncbi:metal-dependent hydrolase [Tabrizicola fusiformis]|uniref:metal-dependent hydrolase n=1 Tax=Tabrizicola sp. SY72 TaxID=2741673 RepID=UPI001572B30E|nr:metal-dependent hydrolase [Tabrizicola sp. SY72]
MILAHLPSGYVLARLAGQPRGLTLMATLAGAVFPDLDLIWFYLIDDRAFHHHRYWVHAPGFWLIIAALALPMIRRFAPSVLLPAALFLAAVFLHLVLDTLAGSIMWLWPFSNRLYALVEVPATRSHWVLSFLTHWSALAELALILWAAVLWFRRPKSAVKA